MAAKTVTVPEEANGVWGEGDDVFVPTERARSLLSFASLPRTAGGAGGHLPAVNSARVSSMLGSLHPHAGHSSWLTATGHLITAIIGAGVLGLPNAVAWLGWVGGILCILTFYVVSAVTCTMLTDCYHVKGKRHTRYKWAVLHIMGPRHSVILAVCQNLNMALTTVGYQIAAADSMRYIARMACKTQGRPADACTMGEQWQHTLVFGAVQVLMSMLPNLESAWWASAIGALMSIGYSTMAVGMAASEAHNGLGTLSGRAAPPIDKAFGVLNSLGSIGFAYSSAIVLLEVQDTLREPPRAAVSMKKAVNTGLGVTVLFYMLVSVLGYLALGDAVHDNVLLSFKGAPAWVSTAANAMVLIHMVSAWQVYAQPVFQTIEDGFIAVRPTLQFATPAKEFLVRLTYRTAYVALTTFISCALPFFGAFTGLVGAITFFPTAVAYPILMYIRVKPTTKAQRSVLWVVFAAMGLVAVGATAGSVESIVAMASQFKAFSSPP